MARERDATRDGLRGRVAALAHEMAANGTERDSPVRSTMALAGDRWSALVLLVLETGEWHHADLRRALGELSSEGAISQRVLTLKLRMLERDGFVSRHASADVPPRVAYRLTPLGHGLVAELRRMIGWIGARSGQIEAARARFDAAE